MLPKFLRNYLSREKLETFLNKRYPKLPLSEELSDADDDSNSVADSYCHNQGPQDGSGEGDIDANKIFSRESMLSDNYRYRSDDPVDLPLFDRSTLRPGDWIAYIHPVSSTSI